MDLSILTQWWKKLTNSKTTHHRKHTFSPAIRQDYVKLAAETIQTAVKNGETPLLVFSGLSGTTLGTAVADEYWRQTGEELDMMYVRREGEREASVAACYDLEFYKARPGRAQKMPKIFFVDDLFSSGTTLRRCIKPFYSRNYEWERGRKIGIFPDRDLIPNEIQVTLLLCEQFITKTVRNCDTGLEIE